MKKCAWPENCMALKAPALNPEIKTGMSKTAQRRDHYQSQAQNQLGIALSALGKAMTNMLILAKDRTPDEALTEVFENITDAGRLLADLHHNYSITRRAFITPSLKELAINVTTETKIDDFLYGKEFTEKLKAAKEVEKASKEATKTDNRGGKPETRISLQKQGFKLQGPLQANKQLSTLEEVVEQESFNVEPEQSPADEIPLKESLEVSHFAGRLRHYVDYWKTVTSDPAILCSVTGYKIPFTSTVSQKASPAEPNLTSDERIAHRKAIQGLLNKGAISQCEEQKGQFLSKYFLRKKSNGEDRFILNLKKLNKFINAPHFKLEDVKTALKLATRDSYMATTDLKDSYFLVPIHTSHKKYLRFTFENKLYEFNALPFGLSIALITAIWVINHMFLQNC